MVRFQRQALGRGRHPRVLGLQKPWLLSRTPKGTPQERAGFEATLRYPGSLVGEDRLRRALGLDILCELTHAWRPVGFGAGKLRRWAWCNVPVSGRGRSG
jgi:hypothetical protein